MRVINQKLLDSSEKTWPEFVDKNKLFFEQFKNEEFQTKMKKEIK
jgi:dTDP-4-dehydrorhamnose 3,5-epimerase-like enzyme